MKFLIKCVVLFMILYSCNSASDKYLTKQDKITPKNDSFLLFDFNHLNDTDLFMNYAALIFEINSPYVFQRKNCEKAKLCDSVTKLKSKDLTGRVISLYDTFSNELDFLKKFFPLDLEARYFPNFTWKDSIFSDPALLYTNHSAFDIESKYLTVNGKISFYENTFYVFYISEFKSLGGSDYLISFNRHGEIMDCIVVITWGHCIEEKGGKFSIDQKFCFTTAECFNFMRTDKNETDTYVIKGNYCIGLNSYGKFELIEKEISQKVINW